jgi:hypothetical protein
MILPRLRHNTRVLLFGGLGNQLFQISAGFSVAGEEELVLDTSLIDSVKNPNWFNSFQDFNVIDNVSFDKNIAIGAIRRRMINLAIRMSSQKHAKSSHGLQNALFFFYALILQLIVFKGQRVFISRGIGIQNDEMSRFRGAVMIGYFQSYELVFPESSNNVLEKIRTLLGVSESQNDKSDQIVVQMRLGDYANNSHIGLLDLSYFQRALSVATTDVPIHSALVFSDDIGKAIAYLSGNTALKIRSGESMNSGAISTLIAMSGHSYFVISNSTFAWWAAALSRSAKKVIAPDPWFSGPDSPPRIIPPNWITVSRNG